MKPDERSPAESNPAVAKPIIAVELYPTLTTGKTELKAVVHSALTLDVTVIDFNDEVKLTPVTHQSLTEGSHQFPIDLSALPSGLYFVQIKSEPGVMTVHRVFKD